MNLNKVIRRIKKDIGLVGLLNGIYSDTVIRDSILTTTLERFNLVHGFNLYSTLQRVIEWGLGDRRNFNLQGKQLEMRLPAVMTREVELYGASIKNIRLIPTPTFNVMPIARGIQDEFRGSWQANESLRINSRPPRALFREPDIIIVPEYGMGRYQLFNDQIVVLNCTHPPNLSTITPGLEDYFEQLAKLDLMVNLWNNELKMVNVDIGTVNINLGSILDEFQAASSNRSQLLEEIKKKAAIDKIEFIWK